LSRLGCRENPLEFGSSYLYETASKSVEIMGRGGGKLRFKQRLDAAGLDENDVVGILDAALDCQE
jgi:hypothetical protein